MVTLSMDIYSRFSYDCTDSGSLQIIISVKIVMSAIYLNNSKYSHKKRSQQRAQKMYYTLYAILTFNFLRLNTSYYKNNFWYFMFTFYK